jgi:hypothetical protein
MWWELGEHVAVSLNAVGLTEARWKRLAGRCPWLACRCDARRKWLNECGEAFWQTLRPEAWYRFRCAWRKQVGHELLAGVLSAVAIRDNLSRIGCGTSLHTFTRWMEELERTCAIASIAISGRKWYGLPAMC